MLPKIVVVATVDEIDKLLADPNLASLLRQGKLRIDKVFFEIDLPKTIYSDVVGMPASMVLGVTIRYYNSTGQALYLKFFVSGTGWSSNSQELGQLAAGGNAYRNFDNFTSRTKPAAETENILHFELKGYTDSGYTNEVYSFSRDTTVKFIKSDDGSWTLDEYDDFETDVEGWAVLWEYQGHGSDACSVARASDQKTHGTYSLKMTAAVYYDGLGRERRTRVFKSFTTPNRNTVYAILNVRVSAAHGVSGTLKCQLKYLQVNRNGTLLIYLGRPYDQLESDYFPRDRWMRIMVPLPKNTTLEVRVVTDVNYAATSSYTCLVYQWLDDFKIISKD